MYAHWFMKKNLDTKGLDNWPKLSQQDSAPKPKTSGFAPSTLHHTAVRCELLICST